MTEVQQIIKTLKNRVNGLLEESKQRHRPGLKQQAEELSYLVEMLEVRLDP